MRKLRLLQIINFWRLLSSYFCVFSTPKAISELITDELYHWKKCDQRKEVGKFDIFSALMLERKEYRSLLHYRMRRGVCRLLVKAMFPGMETLYIHTTNIGPRLYIQHGFATIISARSIRSDCWINQQVTIGYSFDPESPIIGNGVRISAGAKVIGQIVVGNNAIVAANAAVVKDVAENEIVGGVPAKKIGINLDQKLYLCEE